MFSLITVKEIGAQSGELDFPGCVQNGHSGIQVPHSPLSLSNINHFYFMRIDFFACIVCLGTQWVPGVFRGHHRAQNPMELELQVVVRHYVGAGNQIWFLWKNIQCFWLQSHLTSLKYVLI